MHGVGQILLQVLYVFVNSVSVSHTCIPCFPTAVDGIGAVDIVGRLMRVLAVVVCEAISAIPRCVPMYMIVYTSLHFIHFIITLAYLGWLVE